MCDSSIELASRRRTDDNSSSRIVLDGLRRYDILSKVLLIGDKSVGKTTLLHRFVSGEFDPNFLSTIAIDFKTKIVRVRDKDMKLQIWDTSGNKRFGAQIEIFYRDSVGAVFCFDVCDRGSFLNLTDRIKDVEKKCKDDNLIKMVLACKCDRSQERQVTPEEGQLFAIEHKARYWEVSAFSGQNVVAAFDHLSSAILSIKEGWLPLDKQEQQVQMRPKSFIQSNRRSIKTLRKRTAKSLRRSFRVKGSGGGEDAGGSNNNGEERESDFPTRLKSLRRRMSLRGSKKVKKEEVEVVVVAAGEANTFSSRFGLASCVIS